MPRPRAQTPSTLSGDAPDDSVCLPPSRAHSLVLDSDRYGLSYGLLTGRRPLATAAATEQQVWTEMGYGDLSEEGYDEHIARSRTFGAFTGGGECVGVNRTFGGPAPFLSLPFHDELERGGLVAGARAGLVEELGTVAVVRDFRSRQVNLRLWRLAFRDARTRGVQYCGIIMEPARVAKMNRFQGFSFRQLGPESDYQGGSCAPHVMDLRSAGRIMRRRHPRFYYWFVLQRLGRSGARCDRRQLPEASSRSGGGPSSSAQTPGEITAIS